MVLVGDSPQCDPLRNRVIGELPDLPIPPHPTVPFSSLPPLHCTAYNIRTKININPISLLLSLTSIQ
jgi:hypothetical protein